MNDMTSLPGILKLIATNGLRPMTEDEYKTFAGIDGAGFISEPKSDDELDFLIVIGTDDDGGAQIELFGAEGEQLAQYSITAA